MSFSIDQQRLGRTFELLASIDSPSRYEAEVAKFVASELEGLGWTVVEDSSMTSTGSQCGNLVAKARDDGGSTLFFNAHLDTVEPGRGVEVVFENGVFRSKGNTILGGDDKAAVAIMLEVARVLKERGAASLPVEFLFTVCEEIGLLGAKALDTSLLDSRAGYALDSTDPDTIINQAPEAIRFKVTVKGKAAHAGLHPEEGVNAVIVAAKALARLELGRLDEDTTANIGVISGGEATNIVPESVVIEGEARSHNVERLREVQDSILGTFHRVVMEERERALKQGPLPSVETEVRDDYPAMSIPPSHALVVTALDAGKALRRELRVERTGGGSDANILNGKGLECVIMGIGMRDVHTVNEYIALEDMVKTAKLMMEIIERW